MAKEPIAHEAQEDKAPFYSRPDIPETWLDETTKAALAVMNRVAETGIMQEYNQPLIQFTADNQATIPGFIDLQPINAAAVKENARRLTLSIQYLLDPEDAIATAQLGSLSEYDNAHEAELAQEIEDIIKHTPADPEPKPSDLPAIRQWLRSTIKDKEATLRWSAFVNSYFMKAVSFLTNRQAGKKNGGQQGFGSSATTYYFAIHPEIAACSGGQLTTEQYEELSAAHDRLLDYISTHREEYSQEVEEPPNEQEFTSLDLGLFWAFIDSEWPAPDEEPAETQAAIALTGEALKINYSRVSQIKLPTDKLARELFFNNSLALGAENWVKYEKPGSNREISLKFTYYFNEQELEARGIPKGFTSYDFFVGAMLDNMYAAGNRTTTYSKLLDLMGYGKNAGKKQKDELVNSLIKGATTTYSVNDKEVQEAWGNDKYHEVIGGRVFPIYLLHEKAMAGGRITNDVVALDGYTVSHAIASPIEHLTSWEPVIFKRYTGRKTNRYWNVLYYLLWQIGWLRNEKTKRRNKITYSHLYKHTGATTPRAKQLTLEMLYQLLDEVFIPLYVTSYKEDNRGDPGVILYGIKNSPQLPEKAGG